MDGCFLGWVPHPGGRSHVVRVRNAVITVEATRCRKKLPLLPQVPLANSFGFICHTPEALVCVQRALPHSVAVATCAGRWMGAEGRTANGAEHIGDRRLVEWQSANGISIEHTTCEQTHKCWMHALHAWLRGRAEPCQGVG